MVNLYGGVSKTAEKLGVSPTSIRYHLKKEGYIPKTYQCCGKSKRRSDLPKGYRRCRMYESYDDLLRFLEKLQMEYKYSLLTQQEIGKRHQISQQGICYHMIKNRIVKDY